MCVLYIHVPPPNWTTIRFVGGDENGVVQTLCVGIHSDAQGLYNSIFIGYTARIHAFQTSGSFEETNPRGVSYRVVECCVWRGYLCTVGIVPDAYAGGAISCVALQSREEVKRPPTLSCEKKVLFAIETERYLQWHLGDGGIVKGIGGGGGGLISVLTSELTFTW